MQERIGPAGAIQIGDWVLVTELNLLLGAGQEVRLEPRHVDLLVYLSTHSGEVVSTENIIQHVWSGHVVTDHSVYQAIAKLRKAVGDNTSRPRYIETVPKRGYRLIADVSQVPAGGVQDGTSGLTPPPIQPGPEPLPSHAWLKRQWMPIALAMAAILIGSWSFLGRQVGWDQPEYHTVAVLPFAALSESDNDRLIAEGFSIELANALGHSDQVRVIGSISTKLAASLGDSLPEIGQRLNADIVVNGSIRRLNDKLSVSGTLTEVESGHQLWSAVFDRSAEDTLAIQREVAHAVAGALQHTLADGVSTPQQPDTLAHADLVYDNYLLGRYYRSRRNQEDLERAVAYFDAALQQNPRYVPANEGMAGAHLLLSFYGDASLSTALENAQPYFERAIALAPDSAELQALIGLSHYLQGAPGLAEEFLMRAVSTHPSLVEAWMWLGLARQQQGRLHAALSALERASALEPLMITAVVNHANALSWLGKDAEAITLLTGLAKTVNETFDNRAQLYRVLSSFHRSQGSLVDAHEWATRALDVAPQSALSMANMAVTLGSLGQFEQAARLARTAYIQSAPGRGIMDSLARGTIVLPGMLLPRDLIEARLAQLQHLPNVSEIEWRIANLDLGMSAYFDGELDKATAHLRKALDGRDYPIVRADDDIFICLSLVDALQRRDLASEAQDQIARCEQDLENASKQGWDSLSLATSRVRLAVLVGDQPTAHQLLERLFDRGYRGQQLTLRDPVLRSLQQTDAYQNLLAKINHAVDAAWKEISTTRKPSM